MKRREFIALVCGAAVAGPFSARAQKAPERLRHIGVLSSAGADDPGERTRLAAFQQGLQQLGWTGSNVRIEYRWAAGDPERIARYAVELVALAPDVILATSGTNLPALLQATRTVPIVFVRVADPVGAGFVASLAQPGGNATGFIVFEYGIASKWLELLKEIAPNVGRVAFLFNPATAPYGEYYLKPFRAAGTSLKVEAISAPVHDEAEIESVIATHAREPNGGLIAMPDAFVDVHRLKIISLARSYGLPAIYPFPYWAKAGGLISYGPEQIDNFRRAANYADQILKGTKPRELPVQGPVKFAMIINIKDAWPRSAFASPPSRRRNN